MQRWLVDLQLTGLKRLYWANTLLIVLVVILSSILFGAISVVVLCAACGLAYSYTCFLCYHPDATRWREQLDNYYEMLFVSAFGYRHSRNSSNPTTRAKLVPQDISKADSSESRPQPSKLCHREAQKTIQLIMRDFVHQWYGDVTNDMEFPDDVQKLLEHVALETNIRLQDIDLEETVCEITGLVIPYLEVVNETGTRNYNGIEIFDVNYEKCLRAFENNPLIAHRALSSRESELRYYRQALDALLNCAFPDKYKNCDLACMFVRELLLKSIIEPVFDLLCDPDFLLRSIPVILNKASTEKVERELATIRLENEELERRLSHGRLLLKIKGSPISQRRRFQSLSGRFGESEQQSIPSSPEFQHNSPRLKKQYLGKQRPKSMIAIPSRSSWPLTASSFVTHYEQVENDSNTFSLGDPTVQLGVEPESTPSVPRTGLLRKDDTHTHTDNKHTFSSQSFIRSSTLTPSHQARDEMEVGEDEGHHQRHDSGGEDSTWDMIEFPRGPIYVDRHVRVVTGNGSSNHIAYIFKFPKRLLHEDELREVGISENVNHLEGMKRYREFDQFHSSLVKSPLSVHIKGVSLPSKLGFNKLVSRLSLTSSDTDPVVLQERLQGLEKYLQSISAIPMVAASPKFHEFLTSAVQSFMQANIVNPHLKATKKKSFLGMMRGSSFNALKEATQKAEPIPKHSVETVLSAYLDTHLPLPSRSLHSLHRIKSNTSKLVPSQAAGDLHSSSGRNRMGTLINEPSRLSTTDSPVSSINSLCSSDSRGVPTADLAATPKVSADFLPFTKDSKRASYLPKSDQASRSNTGGMDTLETGTDNESSSFTGLTRLLRVPVDDEEGQTIGSINPLSSSSSTSLSEHSVPLNVVKLRSGQHKTKKVTPSIGNQTDSEENVLKNKSQIRQWRKRLHYIFSVLLHYLSLVFMVVKKTFDPITPETASCLAEEHSKRIPLANTLLGLGSEASKRHCSGLWVCGQNTQLALLVLVGGGMERFMWKEFKEVVYSEDNWSRALYHLRHTLWPNGKFMTGKREKPSERERVEMRKEAVAAIKKFLPNFLPVIIGSTGYDNAAHHVLDCLQNPKITRYFLLRIVDVLLLKIMPEINNKKFQRQLAHIRTLTPPRNRFSNANPYPPAPQHGSIRT